MNGSQVRVCVCACVCVQLWVRIQPSLLTALDKAKLVPLSSLPHTRVFRNHAHSQEETQSAAATIGRSLANPYTHSDELLSQPSDSSGIDTNTGQASANGATAMQGVANTQAGVSPQSASSSQPGGASDVKESTGVSQEDVDRVMIHLWKQTAPWKVSELRCLWCLLMTGMHAWCADWTMEGERDTHVMY